MHSIRPFQRCADGHRRLLRPSAGTAVWNAEENYRDSLLLSNGVEGAGTILASYDGMQAELLYSKITNNRLPSQIQGEDGTLVIDNITNICGVVFHDRNGNAKTVIDLPPNHTLEGEVNDWLRMIETGEGIQGRE